MVKLPHSVKRSSIKQTVYNCSLELGLSIFVSTLLRLKCILLLINITFLGFNLNVIDFFIQIWIRDGEGMKSRGGTISKNFFTLVPPLSFFKNFWKFYLGPPYHGKIQKTMGGREVYKSKGDKVKIRTLGRGGYTHPTPSLSHLWYKYFVKNFHKVYSFKKIISSYYWIYNDCQLEGVSKEIGKSCVRGDSIEYKSILNHARSKMDMFCGKYSYGSEQCAQLLLKYKPVTNSTQTLWKTPIPAMTAILDSV